MNDSDRDITYIQPSVVIGFVLVVLMLIQPVPAYSQDQAQKEFHIEEVVVTALRREQRLLDVPVAATAFTADKLDDLGAINFADIANLVPGIEFQKNNEGSARITMRGISSLQGSSATIGVYLDEIPITSPDDQPDLLTFDVERVEVLRGPQGTLYGEASMGGTIKIISKKPDPNNFAAKVDFSFSDTDEGGSAYKTQAMVNLPVVEDTFGIRISANYQDDDGWIDSPTLGNDLNSVEKWGGRITASWLVNDKFTATANIIHQDNDSDSSSQSDGNYDTVALLISPAEDEYTLYNLTLNYELPWATFTSATGYYEREAFFSQDISDIAPGLVFAFNLTCPFPIICEFPNGINDISFNTTDEQETWTQELRLVSSGEGPLYWTLGFFFKDSQQTEMVRGITNPVAVSGFESLSVDIDTDITQIAVYGELTYDLTDDLHITAGIRYFDEDRDISSLTGGLPSLVTGGPSAFADSSSESVWTPKFSLQYDFTDDLMVYGTVARGFRSGGINSSATFVNLFNQVFGVPVPAAPVLFDPDTLWSYEIGWKSQWLDKRLIVEGAVYYIDWTDVQVAGNPGAAPLDFTVNGGDARSKGFELSVLAYPIEGLELGFVTNYTDAELTEDVPDAPDGTDLPQVPKTKHVLSLQYRRPLTDQLTGMFRASWTRIGRRFENLSQTTIFPHYNRLDMRAGIEADKWQLYVFGTNLTSQEGQITDGSSFNERYFIRPRTIGVNLRAEF